MDEIQILIYIVIAVIYLILKGVNKVVKPQESNTPPREVTDNTSIPTPTTQPPNQAPRKTGPLSFEDLLNEFGEVTQKKKAAETAQKKAEQALDKTRKKVSQKLEQTEKKIRRPLETYEGERTFSYEQTLSEEYVPVYRNEANEVDYEDPQKSAYAGLDNQKKRFAPFEQNMEPTRTSIYTRLLRDPQNARTAFILAEIFKRKYE